MITDVTPFKDNKRPLMQKFQRKNKIILIGKEETCV